MALLPDRLGGVNQLLLYRIPALEFRNSFTPDVITKLKRPAKCEAYRKLIEFLPARQGILSYSAFLPGRGLIIPEVMLINEIFIFNALAFQ